MTLDHQYVTESLKKNVTLLSCAQLYDPCINGNTCSYLHILKTYSHTHSHKYAHTTTYARLQPKVTCIQAHTHARTQAHIQAHIRTQICLHTLTTSPCARVVQFADKAVARPTFWCHWERNCIKACDQSHHSIPSKQVSCNQSHHSTPSKQVSFNQSKHGVFAKQTACQQSQQKKSRTMHKHTTPRIMQPIKTQHTQKTILIQPIKTRHANSHRHSTKKVYNHAQTHNATTY